MPDQISADVRAQLHHQEEGYVQAVANSAYIVVKRIDDMFAEMLEGESARLTEYIQAITATDGTGGSSPDIQVLDNIAEEIVPVISDTYNVEEMDVASDITILVEFYSAATVGSLLDNL